MMTMVVITFHTDDFQPAIDTKKQQYLSTLPISKYVLLFYPQPILLIGVREGGRGLQPYQFGLLIFFSGNH